MPKSVAAKTRLLCLVDVANWAWMAKAQALQARLKDFDTEIYVCVGQPHIRAQKHDIYLVFGVSLMPWVEALVGSKKIVCVTAHLAHRDPLMFRKRVSEASALCVNSQMLLEECAGWHQAIYYCPNGVNEKFFTPVKPFRLDAPITFSYVGKHVVEKGLDDILLPAAQVAGVRLRSLARDWRNAVAPESVREHYRTCDVHLVCSTIDGTPNPALEAAACGLTLISNRIGNMPEFIMHGTNGVLVDRVWEQYANAMSAMAKAPEETRAMGRAARQTVLQDWTWDIRAQAYDKMLKEVLA